MQSKSEAKHPKSDEEKARRESEQVKSEADISLARLNKSISEAEETQQKLLEVDVHINKTGTKGKSGCQHIF